jgi:hypothetical protein
MCNSISSPNFISCSYISLQQIGELVSPALSYKCIPRTVVTISNSSHTSLLRLPAQESNDFSDGREGDWRLGVRAGLIPPAEAAMVDVPAPATPRQSTTGTGHGLQAVNGVTRDEAESRRTRTRKTTGRGDARGLARVVLDEGRPAGDRGVGGGAV